MKSMGEEAPQNNEITRVLNRMKILHFYYVRDLLFLSKICIAVKNHLHCLDLK